MATDKTASISARVSVELKEYLLSQDASFRDMTEALADGLRSGAITVKDKRIRGPQVLDPSQMERLEKAAKLMKVDGSSEVIDKMLESIGC